MDFQARKLTGILAGTLLILFGAAPGTHAGPNGGSVVGWGDNTYGQNNIPARLTNAISVAAGGYHGLALLPAGNVVAWGYNTYGETNVPAGLNSAVAVSAGLYHSLALRSNGLVTVWGYSNFGLPNPPAAATNIAAIASGWYHIVGLKRNGTVVAWGAGTSQATFPNVGQSIVPANLTNVTAIAAGGYHSLALRSDGTVVAWGWNASGQTNVPEGLTNVIAVAAGGSNSVALKDDKTVVIWGDNTYGQTNVPAGLSNVVAVSAGAAHILALRNDATLFAWGLNGNGQTNIPAAATNLAVLAAGGYFNLALVDAGPIIFLSQPQSQAACQGTSTTFTAVALGSAPLSYQWQFNGVAIPGATRTGLTVTNAQLVNEGDYSVVVSNAFEMTLSSNAFLNVIDVPEALGPTTLVWLNSSQPAWFAESSVTHDGFAAAAVGPLTNNQQSSLQTSVTGPGTLSFWWADSLEVTLSFYLDGILKVASQQYSPNWAGYTFYLGAGIHVLSWKAVSQYSPYYSGMAYLDQVAYTPGGTAPTINSQPGSQTISAGSNVTFSVGVVGTPQMSFQWYFGGASIAAGTNGSLTLANVQAENAGTYSVVVTNAYGTAGSSNALLSVTPSAPTITTQPVNAYVLLGGQTTFVGAAIGTSPVSYQWLLNGAPIAGATSSSLILGNVQYSSAGAYNLQASNLLGSALSSNAVLFPYSMADLGPALNNSAIAWSTTNMPWFPETNITYDGVSAAQSGAISGGQQSTLQGLISGPATLTYWWKVNCDSFWVNLALFVNGTPQNAIGGNVDWQPATNYLGAGNQVVQWNLYPVHGAFAGGTGWVDQVQVIPGGTAPMLTGNPSSTTTNAGNSVTFSVTAAGTPPLRYQWQFNGSDLPDATNLTATLSNVQTSNAGTYDAVVANDFGSITSATATLTVIPTPPLVTKQPASQSGAFNQGATFLVTAKGSIPLNYQWQFNGSPIFGATTANLVLTNLQATDAGSYRVIVTNAFGAVTSAVAVLEVNSTAVIDYWAPFSAPYATPFGLSNVIAIAAGIGHTVALRQDGSVVSWGLGNYGLTNVPAGLSNVIAISAGDYHTVALNSNGAVVAWGDNTYGQTLVPPGLSNVVAIAAAANDTFALINDGTVVGWGNNLNGQLNIPAGLSNVQAIAAGVDNGFALKTDGTVAQWGNGPVWQQNGVNTQLVVAPGLSNVAAVAAGGASAWSLQNGGQVLAWGWAPFLPPSFFGVVALAAAGSSSVSFDYVLGLKYDGTISLAGPAFYPYMPTIPTSPTGVIGIAAAYEHAAVLMNDGTPRVVARLLTQTVYSSATAVFPSGIIGGSPLSYQWQLNGTNLVGATNSFLLLTNVPLSASGTYGCVAANDLGSVTNQGGTLVVLRSTPIFGPAQLLPGAGFSLELDQLSGHGAVVIYASSNLLDWRSIFTNPPLTGALQFIDSSTTNSPVQFYRAVEE